MFDDIARHSARLNFEMLGAVEGVYEFGGSSLTCLTILDLNFNYVDRSGMLITSDVMSFLVEDVPNVQVGAQVVRGGVTYSVERLLDDGDEIEVRAVVARVN